MLESEGFEQTVLGRRLPAPRLSGGFHERFQPWEVQSDQDFDFGTKVLKDARGFLGQEAAE